MSYPTALYPTIVCGKIWAPTIRYESLDGSILELPNPSGVMELKDFGPFERDGKMWGLTHLQKYSTRGWIKTNPDCFHSWCFWKRQEQRVSDGNVMVWVPNSERGIYFRKPFSWRWDVAGTMIDGKLCHWIWTRGYLGGHWD